MKDKENEVKINDEIRQKIIAELDNDKILKLDIISQFGSTAKFAMALKND